MRLWVDDVRRPPDDSWEWAKTSDEALAMLTLQDKHYELVSLDHDLGWRDAPLEAHDLDPDEDKPYGGGFVDTTRPIVLHWCEYGGWPDEVLVHSSNPVGVQWLEGMIKRYKP